MKPYAEYERTSLDRDPNRTYNDGGWEFSVCYGGGVPSQACVNHTADCPLLRLGREFRTPVEWTDGQHLVWRCTEKTTAAEVA